MRQPDRPGLVAGAGPPLTVAGVSELPEDPADPAGQPTPPSAPVSDAPAVDLEALRAAETLAALRTGTGSEPGGPASMPRGRFAVLLTVLVAAMVAPLFLLPYLGRPAPSRVVRDPAFAALDSYARYLRSTGGDPKLEALATRIRPTLLIVTLPDGSTRLTRRGTDGTCWAVTATAAVVTDPQRVPATDCG